MSSSNFEWTRLIGTTEWDIGDALTTGLDGSIYIAGQTTHGDLDDQPNNGETDAFISKFNSDGNKEWTRLIGTSSGDWAKALTTGLDGSIYIAGYTAGHLDGHITIGGNGSAAFISKFNSDGTKDWTRLVGTNNYGIAEALTTGIDGSIYIAGLSNDDLYTFISKFNNDGTKDWTRFLGTPFEDRGKCINNRH